MSDNNDSMSSRAERSDAWRSQAVTMLMRLQHLSVSLRSTKRLAMTSRNYFIIVLPSTCMMQRFLKMIAVNDNKIRRFIDFVNLIYYCRIIDSSNFYISITSKEFNTLGG